MSSAVAGIGSGAAGTGSSETLELGRLKRPAAAAAGLFILLEVGPGPASAAVFGGRGTAFAGCGLLLSSSWFTDPRSSWKESAAGPGPS